MDVAMSISSALSELKAVNPEMTLGELWKSGRNIGRDMVGTITNTLILAFLGSGFTLMIYLYSLDLPWRELMSSSYLALEVVSGVSSAIGVILAPSSAPCFYPGNNELQRRKVHFGPRGAANVLVIKVFS